VVLRERQIPLQEIESYQRIQQAEDALIQADIAVFHVITILLVDLEQQGIDTVVQSFGMLRRQYLELEKMFPDKAQSFRELVELLPLVVAEPSEENLSNLKRQITQTKINLDSLMEFNRLRREALTENVRAHGDQLAITALALGVGGLILLGTITGFFFSGLTRDLYRLQTRVKHIVQGYRGDNLPVERKDELGQLISGVNQMAETLLAHEQELEIERRKSSFQEKMNAVESLAGGIAQEIVNPITCIVGLSQFTKEQLADYPMLSPDILGNLESIEQYSQKLAGITRNLSAMATPSDTVRQLLDINQLISNTCSLLRYDPHWSGIDFELNLQKSLPAVEGIRDQLSLVLNNIMENAYDAFKNSAVENPTITVDTACDAEGQINCDIRDNGGGMSKEMLAHALDPFYTSKPEGTGAGLGLALSWSIITGHNGTLHLDSRAGEGTCVHIALPASSSLNRASGFSVK
jgi:signal transduction histidine kinase